MYTYVINNEFYTDEYNIPKRLLADEESFRIPEPIDATVNKGDVIQVSFDIRPFQGMRQYYNYMVKKVEDGFIYCKYDKKLNKD